MSAAKRPGVPFGTEAGGPPKNPRRGPEKHCPELEALLAGRAILVYAMWGCARTTTRRCNDGSVRHLSALLRSGECVGVDLTSIGRSWTHCCLGARSSIMRRVDCGGEATRCCATGSVRHLCMPMRSGECAGFGLEAIASGTEPSGKRVRLLAVDFLPSKVFA